MGVRFAVTCATLTDILLKSGSPPAFSHSYSARLRSCRRLGMIRGPFRSVSGHLETRPTRGPAHGPRRGGGTIDWWCAGSYVEERVLACRVDEPTLTLF